jgi:hypothetical protein
MLKFYPPFFQLCSNFHKKSNHNLWVGPTTFVPKIDTSLK